MPVNLFRRQIQIFGENVVNVFIDHEQEFVGDGKVVVLVLEHILNGGDGDE
jgi:hypothetical protein